LNVLDNDTLNGIPVLPTDVTLTVNTPFQTTTTGGVVLNPDGTVTVLPNTPSGIYTATYTICETGATPANCDTANVIVTVTTTTEPVTIVANDDDASTTPVNATSGQQDVINIYTNDTLNGTPVVPTDVTLAILTPFATPNITIDANGNVDVAPNTPAGTYTLTYQICEVANPTNCDTANVTIV
ncbi:hypothetical protein ACFO3U_07600, partial [Flavobacterium ponti]